MDRKELIIAVLIHFYEQVEWSQNDSVRKIAEQRADELLDLMKAA